MLVSRELLAEDPRPCRRLVGAVCRVLTQSACCDAYPRRCQHEPPLHAAFHRAEPGQDERGAAAGRPGRRRRPSRQAEERRPQHGGRAGRPPGRAGAHRQPQLPLLRAAHALALQQDPAHRFQGGGSGGRSGWHSGDRDGRQWWKLLSWTEKCNCGHEKPSCEIQWPQVCRSEWKRYVSVRTELETPSIYMATNPDFKTSRSFCDGIP